jgi:hypothetical protein
LNEDSDWTKAISFAILSGKCKRGVTCLFSVPGTFATGRSGQKVAESMKKRVGEEARDDFRDCHAYNSDAPELRRLGL